MMADCLSVQPQFTAVLAHRKASSGCCGAPLNLGGEPGTFTCQECGQPCVRVLSDPAEVTARG